MTRECSLLTRLSMCSSVALIIVFSIWSMQAHTAVGVPLTYRQPDRQKQNQEGSQQSLTGSTKISTTESCNCARSLFQHFHFRFILVNIIERDILAPADAGNVEVGHVFQAQQRRFVQVRPSSCFALPCFTNGFMPIRLVLTRSRLSPKFVEEY